MNPEIKIDRLYESVLELMNSASAFQMESTIEEEEKLRKVLRKIFISKALYEKNTIAISGLQGVGKSTIIKNFYELDEQSLPIVAGRGERIPILVTEYPIEKPEAYAVINHKNDQDVFVNEEVNVSFEQFKKYARGEDMEAMILGLRVPYKHFHNNVTSFLILPGFEGTGEDYWETLIEFSLTCASTVVFAVNEAKMADQQNKEKVLQILEDYQGIKPIFAMTFADQSKDQNAQLRETIQETFGIEEDHRIVSVGAFTKEENRVWADNFLSAIESQSTMSTDYRGKQLKLLKNLLRKDLLQSVKVIKEELSYVEQDRALERIEKVMDDFKMEADRIRKQYEKNLRESFDACESEARRKAMNLVENKSTLVKLKEVIMKKSLKDLRIMEEKVHSMMAASVEGGSGASVFELMNREATVNTLKQKLGIGFEENGRIKRIEGIQGKYDIVEVEDQEDPEKFQKLMKRGYFLSPQAASDLQTIMMTDQEFKQITSRDLSPTIRMIPAIATLNYGTFFNEIYLDTRGINAEDKSNQFKNWKEVQNAPKEILKGLVSVAGLSLVDVTDGSPDIILGAAKALGIKVSQNAALAMTGGIAAGALAVGILRVINQNSISDFNQYTAGFRVLREFYEEKFKERYESYMESVEENLKQRLMEGYGVTVLDSRVDNLLISVNRVENRVREMEEMMNAIYA